ncbi:MAG: bifunctional adenosylcobinamide kinase/adenosylcobinamide-phosphate guanylyltransferase [Pseudarcicella sp.]|nr:bifunctional adenosylcobinamide kinase/adenosylcobinamide-phosphate guanylyltransferase [Pseudarcicella sp.]MBP6409801.1 bifunctional adenosylcobinamide kinase/adenosylcobinamide-phosphate guanylyltransferase [Pseudarcicella sp.]
MIWMITGGARSGKSNYAQQIAKHETENPCYLATAKHWDDDFTQRIKNHQSNRDNTWQNIEEQLYIGELQINNQVVVIDCVTLWLSNVFVKFNQEIEPSLAFAKNEIDQLTQVDKLYIVITNEIGMGVHAETSIGRKFTDLQGWVNQYLANKSQKVTLMVSGIPMEIKSELN